MIRRATVPAVLLSVLGALAVWASSASATFHEMMIREIYPGSSSKPDSEYVELQMWAAGQNFVEGHSILLYDATGKSAGSATFAGEVSRGVNQSTLLAATPVAISEFGVAADVELPAGTLDPAGGAACWESFDCVAWGSFTGPAGFPAGQPAAPAGIPDGMALRRTIVPGCATLLEPGDDRDNSAIDFSSAFPAPRPNSVAPAEHGCTPQDGGAGNGGEEGGSGAAMRRHPQTRISRQPGRRIRDRTPTFGFASSIAGSAYLCRLDRRSFKRCHSPFTAHRLGLGRHVFKVKARAPDGAFDLSPAAYHFEVVKSKRARRP